MCHYERQADLPQKHLFWISITLVKFHELFFFYLFKLCALELGLGDDQETVPSEEDGSGGVEEGVACLKAPVYRRKCCYLRFTVREAKR